MSFLRARQLHGIRKTLGVFRLLQSPRLRAALRDAEQVSGKRATAMTRKALPVRVDVSQLISAGVLASVCPRALIEEVLCDTGKASRRERLLSALSGRVLPGGGGGGGGGGTGAGAGAGAGAVTRGAAGGSAARGVRRLAIAWWWRGQRGAGHQVGDLAGANAIGLQGHEPSRRSRAAPAGRAGRVIKRKMINFDVRHCRETAQRQHQPTPAVRF